MSNHSLIRRFFNPPSHRRAVGLIGLGFGTVWALVYAFDQRLFSLPYVLLPAMLILQGFAEVLPRAWVRFAPMLRFASLTAGATGVVWLLFKLAGWIPQ